MVFSLKIKILARFIYFSLVFIYCSIVLTLIFKQSELYHYTIFWGIPISLVSSIVVTLIGIRGDKLKNKKQIIDTLGLPEINVLVSIYAFFAFLIVSLLLGGYAMTGKIVNKHFFLGYHGYYEPVSFLTYLISILCFGFIPTYMLVSWYFVMRKHRNRVSGGIPFYRLLIILGIAFITLMNSHVVWCVAKAITAFYK